MIYYLARSLVMLLFYICFSVHYEGKENVPKGGKFIVVSNHVHNIDPIFIAGGVSQKLRYMGKAELFENPFLNWLFRQLGAFPVNRGSGDTSALDYSIEIIQEGGCLGMFPEGTRSRDGKPLRPKSGAAHIAKISGADILPACIVYDGKLRFRTRITIRYGPVIPHEELGFGEGSAAELKKATRILFGGVLELLGVGEDGDNSR